MNQKNNSIDTYLIENHKKLAETYLHYIKKDENNLNIDTLCI